MDFGVTGRAVIITGASRGIGRALAGSLSSHGARLGLIARDEGALKELASQLPADVAIAPCDVTDDMSVEAAVGQIAGELGGVDSMVINAGIAPESHRAHNLRADAWRRVLEVNLTGAFLSARAGYRHLAASGRGKIVFISSVMARSPRRGVSAYAASKAGMEGLARALAADWARDHICVNAVAPGFFDVGLGAEFAGSRTLSEQVRSRVLLGRFGEPAELATSVMFLIGDGSGYLTGQTLGVDGGYGPN
jgi:NAD(P)-dependent dehydrogenase (short-subunit alcohol dehydrogenase family)